MFFARYMLAEDERGEKDGDNEIVEVACEGTEGNDETTADHTEFVLPGELMTKFDLMMTSTIEDLLGNVVNVSACLEKKDKGSLRGSVSCV